MKSLPPPPTLPTLYEVIWNTYYRHCSTLSSTPQPLNTIFWYLLETLTLQCTALMSLLNKDVFKLSPRSLWVSVPPYFAVQNIVYLLILQKGLYWGIMGEGCIYYRVYQLNHSYQVGHANYWRHNSTAFLFMSPDSVIQKVWGYEAVRFYDSSVTHHVKHWLLENRHVP